MRDQQYENLVAQGLARYYRGRLIPIMKGGAEDDPAEPLFAEVPDDLSSLSTDDIRALIEDYEATRDEVLAGPTNFTSDELTLDDLFEVCEKAVKTTLPALQAELAKREAAGDTKPELSAAEKAAFEALKPADKPDAALETTDPADPPEGEEKPEGEATATPSPVELLEAAQQLIAAASGDPDALTAAAGDGTRTGLGRMPAPSASRRPLLRQPAEEENPIALTAAGGAYDLPVGHRFGSELELAEAMVRRWDQFGDGGPDVVERFAVAKANWKDRYSADRTLVGKDEVGNFDLIKPVIDGNVIKRAFAERQHEQDKEMSMVASGGLCAPVTPWYNLQYISVPVRPVQGSLPSFNADRGGLRYARPAALSAVTTAVGLITEAEDHAGGSMATKTCQVIPCPPFIETDVDIIYHCLQFGNLGARAFPELVAQWNNLVLAAHARLAESNLLTQIDAFSTQVTAASLGLGAVGDLLGQILTAAEGLRNRNRMDPEAVLRIMLPWWSVSLLVSDVIRSQFQRFDTDQERIIALLRSFNIEPTFYIDGAAGRNQVYGAQDDGPLLPFPPTVVWYLFPEGSFLYLDAGMLELGIVRDSVLNKTNDFQIFGETFENVAFVGVESLAVVSTVCDSGTVALPTSIDCPIVYGE